MNKNEHAVKRKGRHILAVLLTLAMVVGLAPPQPAYAAISLPTEKVTNQSAKGTPFIDQGGSFSSFETPAAFPAPYQYGFSPEATSKTTYSHIGTESRTAGEKEWEAKGIHHYHGNMSGVYAFSISGQTKGDIGVAASGLRVYNPEKGQWDEIDMRITVDDWDIEGATPFIYLQKNTAKPNIYFTGISEIKVTYHYYVANTKTPYTMKSNLTYSDIDVWQYIGFDSGKVARQYAAKDSELNFGLSGKSDIYHFAGDYDETVDPPTDKYAAGILFESSSFSIIYGSKRMRGGNGNYVFFDQEARSMARFAPPPPAKTVSSNGQSDKLETVNVTTAQAITYKVTQMIPDGMVSSMYYDSFVMRDEIDSCLAIDETNVRVIDRAGKVVSPDWFTIKVSSGNVVTATAKKAALGDSDFYGKSIRRGAGYSLIIPTHIRGDAPLEAHGHISRAKDQITVRNGENGTTTVTIDDHPQHTNAVKTDIPLPKKTVSDSDEPDTDSNRLNNMNETFTYKISQKVAGTLDEAKLKTMVFTDQIDSCLNIHNTRILDETGTDRSEWFDITVSGGNLVTAAAKAAALSSADFYGTLTGGKRQGRSYTLTIDCALNKAASYETLKNHGHLNPDETELTLRNRANVKLADGAGMDTDWVTTKVGLPDLEIAKAVKRYENQVNDRIQYTLTVKHTAKSTADATDVVVRDISLPDGFTVDPGSLAVSGLITQAASFEQAAGGFLFKADMIGMKETAVITYEAIPGKAFNGKIIDNTASVSAFAMAKEKQASASVYINSPKLDLAKETHKREYKVGEVISYTLTLSQRNPGTFMRDILITDNITQSGVSLLPGSIQVMDSDGKLMTHLCDITVTGNAFQILTHRDMGAQDKRIPPKEAGISPYTGLKPENRITVTYDVSVKEQALSGFTVDNVALSPATPNTDGDLIKENPDIPSGGSHAERETPVVGAKLKIEKGSDKDIYQLADTAKYTLKVSQVREDYTARNVVVRDALHTTLAAIAPGSIKVTLNRKDITASCAIKVSAGAFEIATGKDLAWGDSLIVTYQVRFDPSAKGEVIRNTAITYADNAKEAEDDNTVGVEPGKAALKIIKESEKREYQVGDSAKYHLSVTCISSAPAINVIIRDRLDTTGASISPGSIHVSMGGIDITTACAMEVTRQAFTIRTGKALKEGEGLLVTYDVVIEDASLIGKAVKNIAVAGSSNANEDKDDHLITIVPGPGKPEESTLSAIHYSGGSSARKQAGKQPKTGDGFDPLMLIVMLVAIAGIIGSLMYRRSALRKKT